MVKDATYRVRLVPSGTELQVRANETLLGAARKAGIDLVSSCKLGYCGACGARLVAGSIVYPSGQVIARHAGQEEPEIMLCIARPQSDAEVQPLYHRTWSTVPLS
jgi:ferredoxin